MEEGLADAADALYALPPAEFTGARDAMAKQLRPADPALAAAVKALRRPSLAAWVVNLLVRREADQVGQVLAVGASLREAQANLDGEQLRALTRQRRQLTAAMTSQARRLAAEHGLRVTAAVAEQVEATLTAAMLDRAAGDAVSSGLLVAPLAPTGLAGADLEAALAVPSAAGRRPAALGPPGEPPAAGGGPTSLRAVHTRDDEADSARAAAREARRAAEKRVAEARAAAARADSELAEATRRVARLQAVRLQLGSEIDELSRRIADLEARAEATEEELAEAEEDHAAADRRAAGAAEEQAAAAAALSALGESR